MRFPALTPFTGKSYKMIKEARFRGSPDRVIANWLNDNYVPVPMKYSPFFKRKKEPIFHWWGKLVKYVWEEMDDSWVKCPRCGNSDTAVSHKWRLNGGDTKITIEIEDKDEETTKLCMDCLDLELKESLHHFGFPVIGK